MRKFCSNLCSVSGIAKVFPAIPVQRLQGITNVLLDYLKQSASVINTPGRPKKPPQNYFILAKAMNLGKNNAQREQRRKYYLLLFYRGKKAAC